MSKLSPAEVDVIVVNYNTPSLTKEAIASLCKETKLSINLILVDNNSADDSLKILRDIKEIDKFIALNENVGFAQANNIAARESSSDYILLLNPDTVVLNQAVDKLFEFSQRYRNSLIWGGKTLFPNHKLNPTSCWDKQTISSLFFQSIGLSSIFRKSCLFNQEGIGCWDRDGVKFVDIVSGCFFLIKRDLWEKLGGFDRDFFMYGEEADLCLRAKKYGANPVVTSDAVIVHYGGASEKVKTEKMIRLLKAKMLLIDHHFSNQARGVGRFLLAMWPLSRLIAFIFWNRLFSVDRKVEEQTWKEIWNRRTEWRK